MSNKGINLLNWRAIAYRARLVHCSVIFILCLTLGILAAKTISAHYLTPTSITTFHPHATNASLAICNSKAITQQLKQISTQLSLQRQRRLQHNRQAKVLSTLVQQCHTPCQLTELKFSQGNWLIAGLDNNAVNIEQLLHRLNQPDIIRFHLQQISDTNHNALSFLIEGKLNDQ